MSGREGADTVFLQGLELEAVIGVHDWERELRQALRADLELAVDARRAAATDALADALDYQAVAERVVALAAASEYQLVETLAEAIAAALLEEFALESVRLRLAKPGALPGSCVVGVQIERRRAGRDE